ncbi:anti-sigma factor family protein [Dyella soli]|uniref:Zf-HC2 domain-containing protein n=1 Tax=Dyella soli TaxID=522319 RepID=A0A4R0YMU9_9GAMM|nr:zf-HC2 domain-containing protein [Dyella soli]TCI10229.1 zf-HC2 domain-containing protein [Dyella soli]
MTMPMDSVGGCARAWETMPWVLQDSATQEQGEWLMEHLAHCEPCRAEFAQQSRLRVALSLPSDIPLDVDVGLKRLLGRIDTPESQQSTLHPPARSWFTRALVAAVLVQAIGIGVIGARLWSDGSNPGYRTLSQQALPAAPGAIHVVPDSTMKVADWNALLHNLKLQVVSGPNDVGAYTVIAIGAPAVTQHTLQQLRATRGIRLAEPVAATP